MRYRAYPLPMPEIETERLRLRRFRPSDLHAAYAWGSDQEVSRYAFWDTHESPVDTQGFLDFCYREYEEKGIGPWAVELKESGETIGNCSFGRIYLGDSRIEIAYFFARPHWNRGYATEGVRAMLGFGFDTLECNRMEARCVPANAASERVMQKAGLEYQGTLTFHIEPREQDVDLKVYSLLRWQWLARAGAAAGL